MNLAPVEIKAFVPARDFALSKRFYEDVGFEIEWADENLAYVSLGPCSFLLQNFHVPDHTANFMMHLLVEDVDDWHAALVARDIAGRYGVAIDTPRDQPWGMRDFTLFDPSGVLWRIGQNLPERDGGDA